MFVPAVIPIAGGSIAEDVTWTAAESPYVVQADITIETGGRLTLEPGVEVRFQKRDASEAGSDPARIELTVRGMLHAEGTQAAPIVLHSDEDDYPNSWHGIVVDSSAEMALLSHLEIEGATTAISSAAPEQILKLSHARLRHNFTGLALTAGAPKLDSLRLSENSLYGLFVDASSADVTFRLQNSVSSLNGSYGVFVSVAAGHATNGRIFSSTIYGNTSSGVTSQVAGTGASATLAIANAIVATNGIIGVDSSAVAGGVADVAVEYTDVFSNGTDFMGVTAGEGCLAADPLFVDAPSDLRIGAGSPCIDSGTEANAPTLDVLGRSRPVSRGFDMGAYEYRDGDQVGSAGAATEGGAAGASTQPSAIGGAPTEPSPASSGGEAGNPALVEPEMPAINTTNSADEGCACSLPESSRSSGGGWLLSGAWLVFRHRRRSTRADDRAPSRH
jgi:hypothetical protein